MSLIATVSLADDFFTTIPATASCARINRSARPTAMLGGAWLTGSVLI
jgi:hypothetical protein